MLPSEVEADLVNAARDLASRFPGVPPPLRDMAQHVGIGLIDRRRNLPVSGLLLERSPKEYVAIICASDPPTRQRFSLAHEIAHVLVSSADVTSELSCLDPSVERLCDRLAAELVLPAALFPFPGDSPGLAEALAFGDACRASPVAAALRLVDLDPTLVIVAWGLRSRPGSTRKLRVIWSRTPPGVYVPRLVTPPTAMKLTELGIGDREVARYRLSLGNLKGEHVVESQRIRASGADDVEVLSVVSCTSAAEEVDRHAS